MDPALHLQQRIAQGLNNVTLSLRSSFNSLVLGGGGATTPGGAAGPTTNANASANNHAAAAAANTNNNVDTTSDAASITTTFSSTTGGASSSSRSATAHNPSDDADAANPVTTTMSTGADVDLEKGQPELEQRRYRTSSQGGSSSIAVAAAAPGPHDHGHDTPPASSSQGPPPEPKHQLQTQDQGTEWPHHTDDAETTAETGAVAETAMVLRQRRQRREPLTLQTLPPEVLMLVIRQLNFGDIERLRRTSHFFHDFAAPRMVRALFGAAELRRLLLSHCSACLAYDEDKSGLLLASVGQPGYPLCARCVECAVARRDDRLVVGRKVTMGDGGGVWVCRWCGWPVVVDAALGHVQFHRACYGAYNDSLLFFFLLGWVQLGLGIVAGALAWTYYRDEISVFAPTITSFILLWVCFFMLMFRGNRVRTYHWTLLAEALVLCLWVMPLHYIISLYVAVPHDQLPRSTMACLIIFLLNTYVCLFFSFFRLFFFLARWSLLANLFLSCADYSGC